MYLAAQITSNSCTASLPGTIASTTRGAGLSVPLYARYLTRKRKSWSKVIFLSVFPIHMYRPTIQSVRWEQVAGTREFRYLIVKSSHVENSEHLQTNDFRARFRTHRCGHACQRARIQVCQFPQCPHLHHLRLRTTKGMTS